MRHALLHIVSVGTLLLSIDAKSQPKPGTDKRRVLTYAGKQTRAVPRHSIAQDSIPRCTTRHVNMLHVSVLGNSSQSQPYRRCLHDGYCIAGMVPRLVIFYRLTSGTTTHAVAHSMRTRLVASVTCHWRCSISRTSGRMTLAYRGQRSTMHRANSFGLFFPCTSRHRHRRRLPSSVMAEHSRSGEDLGDPAVSAAHLLSA